MVFLQSKLPLWLAIYCLCVYCSPIDASQTFAIEISRVTPLNNVESMKYVVSWLMYVACNLILMTHVGGTALFTFRQFITSFEAIKPSIITHKV